MSIGNQPDDFIDFILLKKLKSINHKVRKGLRKDRKELIHMFLTLRTLRSYPPKVDFVYFAVKKKA